MIAESKKPGDGPGFFSLHPTQETGNSMQQPVKNKKRASRMGHRIPLESASTGLLEYHCYHQQYAVCNYCTAMMLLNVGRLARGFVPKCHAGAPRNAPIEAVNAKRATYFLATI